jgi:hypothetical protein
MKHFSTRIIFGLLVVGFLPNAIAARRVASAGKPVVYLGSALDGSFTGSSTSPAVSSLFTLGDIAALQFYVGIPTINPFNVGGGVNFKYSVVGDNSKGFHIGGGIAVGAAGGSLARTVFINVVPNFGLHFEIVERVLVSFDTSLAFNIRTASASNLELTLGGNSNLLGASILFGL